MEEDGWFKQYPVTTINWWEASFTPLPIGKKVYGDLFYIGGGINQRVIIRHGTAGQVEAEVKKAIDEASD